MRSRTLSLLMVLLGWGVSCGAPTAETETPAATRGGLASATAPEWKAGGEPGGGARLSLGHRLGGKQLVAATCWG